mmetsp:Transcript_87755/g.246588  ORF Transcript_87755/g.246588 Transcript_87755/m.246588 type:complete len:300 (-) Transcript_87755:643-1542(-)
MSPSVSRQPPHTHGELKKTQQKTDAHARLEFCPHVLRARFGRSLPDRPEDRVMAISVLAGALLLRDKRGEDLPEPQGLVSGRRAYQRPVGALREVQQTSDMTLEVCCFHERWVLPQGQVVPGVAMRGDELALLWAAPSDAGNLALSVGRHKKAPAESVPKADLAVRGAAAGGEHTALPGAPPQRLHRRAVLSQRVQRCARCDALPDANRVVVPAGGQGAPRAVVQAADEVRVSPYESAGEVIFHAHVVVMHLSIDGAAAQHVLVPCECADTAAMTPEAPQLSLGTAIPYLHLARRGADA